MKIHADELLEDDFSIGIPVKIHPAFANLSGPTIVNNETRDLIIKKWEMENCKYECVDGVWGYYYDNGEEE